MCNTDCETRRWKDPSFWGCFAARGVGHIHHIKGIMDQKVYKQILIRHMRPSLLQFGDHIIFQQDNDPKCMAKSVENYIKRAKYQVLRNWPAQSPDINPIENLWQELRTRVVRARPWPANKGALFDLVKREWKCSSWRTTVELSALNA